MKNPNSNIFKGFIDTTFRDGQQSPLMFDSGKYRFTFADKKALLNGLISLGITQFEFFSPVVSKGEKNDFVRIKEFLKEKTKGNVSLLAHVRCHIDDIREAMSVGFDGLNMYMGIAERSQKYSLGFSFDEISRRIKETIISVRMEHPNLYIRFSVEDCFRTPIEDTFRIYDTIYPYINTFGMPDTVGVATPESVKQRVLELKKRYPKAMLECHFHNDRGMSLVNSLIAIEAGATFIDTSIWGMAERSGITSITGILLNLFFRHPEFCKNYHLEYCYPINVLMGSILKLHVPYNEPVSLTNRTHTAGVHQKAVLNNHSLYEANDLQKFGVTRNQLLLGPLSGWNLIYYYLREIDYYDVTVDQAKDITRDFKQQAHTITKKNLPEMLLSEVVKKYKLGKLPVKEKLLEKRIENLQ